MGCQMYSRTAALTTSVWRMVWYKMRWVRLSAGTVKGIGTGESGEGLCFDEVCEIVIVPCGGFQAQSD